MWKSIVAGSVIVLAVASAHAAPTAAPVPAPLTPLPRAFAGYAQPQIPATACQVISAAEARCSIPAMTAGPYLIEATATSTATAADATQAMEIDVGGGRCGVGRNTAAWSSGARSFTFGCQVTVLADSPLSVRVLYGDKSATKDPRGPQVVIRPLPWNGVLSAVPFAPKQ